MRSLLNFVTVIFIFTSCMPMSGSTESKFDNLSSESLIDSIQQFKAYEGEFEGLTGDTTQQWRFYRRFANKASEIELVNLCESKDPVIRCYAFQALTDRCSDQIFPILLKHLEDTAGFDRYYGCSGGSDRVCDNFLDAVTFNYESSDVHILSKKQYDYLDSILLYNRQIEQIADFGHIKYRSRRYVLERIKPLPVYYRRIREIVLAGVYEALPVLAKYQKPADTSIFISLLLNDEFSNRGRNRTIHVRRAIADFPHPSFFPVLRDLLWKEIGTNAISDQLESFPLYVAMAQYASTETRQLFINAIDLSPREEKSQRSHFIYHAIKLNPAPIFEGIVSGDEYCERKYQ